MIWFIILAIISVIIEIIILKKYSGFHFVLKVDKNNAIFVHGKSIQFSIDAAYSAIKIIWGKDSIKESKKDDLSFYVYKSLNDRDSWNRNSRTDDNASNMIYVYPKNGKLVLVFEDSESNDIKCIINILKSKLNIK
jgi:hypothetical protein